MNIYDAHDDVTRSIRKIIEAEYIVPEFAKHASFDPGQLSKEATKSLFADPINKRYPMDTEADLWWSNAYFSKTAHKLNSYNRETIKSNLEKMANMSGVDIKVNVISSKPEVVSLGDYALSLNVSGTKMASLADSGYITLYPINTPERVKLANKHFPNMLDGDLEGYRPKVAREIAARTGDDRLSDEVRRYLPIPKSAALVDMNKRAALSPKYASSYKHLKESIDRDYLDNDDNCNIFVESLSNLDKKANIEKYYDSELNDPTEYMRQVYEDRDLSNETVKIASKDFKMGDIENSLPELREYLPEVAEHISSPAKFANYVSGIDPIVQEAVALRILK